MKERKRIGASYSRVSDEESASKEHGSLEQQEHMARDEADRQTLKTGIEHKIEYVLTEKDGVSGGSTKRPEYQKLLKLITARKIDFVVAKEISRLNRSTKDFCDFMEHCQKNNVSVYIKGLEFDFDSPMGGLMYKLLALIAEFERTMIIQRTRSGIRSGQLNNSKIHGGRVLLGFDKHKTKAGVWVPNKKELKKVERILEIVMEHDSYKGICKAVKEEGIVGKYGNQFRSDSLKRLVFSRRYEGILEIPDGDEILTRELGFGVVVDLEKLEQAREKLREFDKKFLKTTRVRNRTYLLTGILFYKDGSKFSGMSGTKRDGNRKYYYWCGKHKVGIPAEELEKAIILALSCYQDDNELQAYVNEALKDFGKRTDLIDDQIKEVKQLLKNNKLKEEKLLDSLLGKNSSDVGNWLEKKLKEIREEFEMAELDLEKLEREKVAMERTRPNFGKMKNTLGYVFENFDKVEPSVQRNFMRDVFEKIEVSENSQIKLFWKFPDLASAAPLCGTGGSGFALEKKWGG